MNAEGGLRAALVISGAKSIARRFPGPHPLALSVRGPAAEPETIVLTLGPEWGVDASPACLRALRALGEVRPAG